MEGQNRPEWEDSLSEQAKGESLSADDHLMMATTIYSGFGFDLECVCLAGEAGGCGITRGTQAAILTESEDDRDSFDQMHYTQHP